MVVDLRRSRLPAVSQEISKRHKCGGPQQRAQVSEHGEDVRLHVRHARGVCRQMADARNEVAEGEAPMAHTFKELVSFGQTLLGQVDVLAETMDQRQAEGPASTVPKAGASFK